MGITGLLPFIKNSCRPANLKDFSGATVAIDAYSWLHKGAFSCAEKLVKGEKTDGYVFYCVKLLNMLLEVGVKPIMVFDGCNLSSKAITEKKRRENREKTKQRGKELLCEGKVKEARECFQRCVDVTPEMAREVIEMCRKKSIDCIVAPYEADAQLAYLDKTGIAQIIITEDSDLVLFGCNKILFKMDSFGGGLLYEKENLPKSFGSNASKFSFEKFRYICILSGCDYLSSLPGIGLGKACKFFMLTCNLDLNSVLKKLPSYLKMPKLEVTDEYIDSFIKANNTFLYQLVFCPQKKCLVPLNPYPEGVNDSDMEYAGKYLPDDLAQELAIGDINVKTLKKFRNSETTLSYSDAEKNAVWVSISNVNKKKNSAKVEVNAFQFNSQKIKGVKRKIECDEIKDTKPSFNDDEELFSMYRNLNSSIDVDELEEDPLVDIYEKKPKMSSYFSPGKSESPNVPEKDTKLSLKRVVRSRFFASKTETTEEPETVVLRENSPENKINTERALDTDTDILHEESVKKSVEAEQEIESSTIKSNKENIVHRFAKKVDSKQSSSVSSADITSSLCKVERSWLDIIDNECSPTTLSSGGLATTVLCLDSKDSSVKKDASESNIVKIKKTKLISTKILDFKWDKDAGSKRKSNSLDTQANSSTLPSVKNESEVHLEPSLNKMPKKAAYDFTNNALEEVIDLSCDREDDLPLSASSSRSSSSFCSQNSSSTETVISSRDLKQSSKKSLYKPGKCRQIGLSKNRKSSDKKVLLKETLMNFNFVKKPKSEMSASMQ